MRFSPGDTVCRRAGVGARPRLPERHELTRVRYTPITMPFEQAALLSHRIASGLGYVASNDEGYGASDDEGKAEGILVDVAELWELFVLNCARVGLPGLQVEDVGADVRYRPRRAPGSRRRGRAAGSNRGAR
jgi:hypothetical protein